MRDLNFNGLSWLNTDGTIFNGIVPRDLDVNDSWTEQEGGNTTKFKVLDKQALPNGMFAVRSAII